MRDDKRNLDLGTMRSQLVSARTALDASPTSPTRRRYTPVPWRIPAQNGSSAALQPRRY